MGTWHSRKDGITTIAKDYYKNIFTSTNPNRKNMDRVLNLVDKLVTPAMNHHLLQVYTADEIRLTLFQMHPSKFPGPDGMSLFSQKFWHIVGHDVVEAILSVLNFGHFLHKIMNFTHIVLIPKVNESKHM